MNVRRLGKIIRNMPLIVRVVCLYILAGIPLWYAGANGLMTHPMANHVRVVRTAPKVLAEVVKSGMPVRVAVPILGINLGIVEGTYDANSDSWTLTDDKAQFAAMTDLPNDRAGNTFIYGHNTDAVFAKLSALKAGDVAEVKTSNGYTFQYIYNGQQIVQPNNTDILNNEPSTPQLTLMTCEGIFSQTRRIMFFDFKDVI